MVLLVLSFKPNSHLVVKMLQSREFYKTRDSRQGIQELRRDNVDFGQNRELQIMRIVRHPNVVELKAFYYSNGERVCYGTLE